MKKSAHRAFFEMESNKIQALGRYTASKTLNDCLGDILDKHLTSEQKRLVAHLKNQKSNKEVI